MSTLGAGIWLFHRQVLREEDYLKKHYGREYLEYCNQVRRYLRVDDMSGPLLNIRPADRVLGSKAKKPRHSIMPPHNWLVDPVNIIQQFEGRHNSPDAGALFAWAVLTVDCLYYLDDLDQVFDSSRMPLASHRPDVMDVAHARWATGTSITSLDLCAAGLGRAFCAHKGTRELDLGDLNPTRRAQLSHDAQRWIDRVLTDPQYNDVKSARDWLRHSRIKSHFVLTAGGPPQRLTLEFGSSRLPVRDLIELARDLTTRHVSDFLQILPPL